VSKLSTGIPSRDDITTRQRQNVTLYFPNHPSSTSIHHYPPHLQPPIRFHPPSSHPAHRSTLTLGLRAHISHVALRLARGQPISALHHPPHRCAVHMSRMKSCIPATTPSLIGEETMVFLLRFACGSVYSTHGSVVSTDPSSGRSNETRCAIC
jgi:hypothetical protein